MMDDPETVEGLGQTLDAKDELRGFFRNRCDPLYVLQNLAEMGADIGPAVGALGRALKDPDGEAARKAAQILLIAAAKNRQDIEAAEPYLLEALNGRRSDVAKTAGMALVLFHYAQERLERTEKLKGNDAYMKEAGRLVVAIGMNVERMQDADELRKARAFALLAGNETVAKMAMDRLVDIGNNDVRPLHDRGFTAGPLIQGPPTAGAMCRRKEIKRR